MIVEKSKEYQEGYDQAVADFVEAMKFQTSLLSVVGFSTFCSRVDQMVEGTKDILKKKVQ